MPIKHGEGAFVARPDELTRIEDEGLVVFRYATPTASSTTPTTRTARSTTSRGSGTRAGNVVGLMPHPEHAVDPDVGPTGGQPLFASLLASAHGGSGA